MPRSRTPSVAKQLAPYRRKRDFAKTSEPTGGRHKPGAGLRFVVQEHAARRLHYDFRLEMGGVLKSWAIPKGPSLDPREKRLAVHVEDHPLDYGDFEGVIPQGEYGGGTVIVWDTGTWVPEGDPEAAYRDGELKFELKGKRLTGRWALVQMKRREGGKNWLLVKDGDDSARPGSKDTVVAENQTSAVSGRDLATVAKSRDRVWHSNRGDNANDPPARSPPLDPSSVPRARKAAMPEVPEPQLAKSASTVPKGEGWLHEIKLDGYRLLARIRAGKVRLLTRRGNDWTDKFPTVVEALAALRVSDAILDGEVVHLLPNGLSSFAALQDDLAREDTSSVVYYTFDLLYLDGFDLTAARLDARKEALKTLLAAAPPGILRYSDHIVGKGDAFQEKASRLGLEGVISKRADAPYRPGRSGAWTKAKFDQREDLAIIGWTDPSGNREGFGALLMGYYDPAGKLHFAGGVGTGFTDETLRTIRRRLEPLARKTAPSREVAKAAPRRAHWVEPELVAELRYARWTSDGRLREPAFLGLREDKTGAEIVLDPNTRAAAMTAEPESPAPVPPAEPTPAVTPHTTLEIEGVRLTHAGKVLYPEDNITKLDLVRYYGIVADRMLPELAGRPLTLLRAPEGYRGHHFYQKHGNATVPKAVRRIRIAEREGGEEGIYLVADDRAALFSLVQMGVLEIHVWGSRESDIAHPDRVVFDLDPDEGLPWPRVVEGAFAMRRLLEDIGLESFPKATGGKGLHVVVPLRPLYDWTEIKAFAKSLADDLARLEPNAYTAVMAKKKRHGRIFIDYLRNQRGASAIAAYSARARPRAPVAAPLTWNEVEAGIHGDAFTVKTLPERLASLKKDPWEGIERVKQSLPAAVRRKLSAA